MCKEREEQEDQVWEELERVVVWSRLEEDYKGRARRA